MGRMACQGRVRGARWSKGEAMVGKWGQAVGKAWARWARRGQGGQVWQVWQAWQAYHLLCTSLVSGAAIPLFVLGLGCLLYLAASVWSDPARGGLAKYAALVTVSASTAHTPLTAR